IDDAALGGAKLSQKSMRDIEHAKQVGSEDVLPVPYHRSRVSGERVAAVDPPAIHQDWDWTDIFFDEACDFRAGVRPSYISPKTFGLAPRPPDPIGGFRARPPRFF